MIQQGSFVYIFYDKMLSVNVEFGRNVYNLIPDFADFLDRTNETYMDYQEWFFEKITNHPLLLYNPNVSEHLLVIDAKNKLLFHDAPEDFLKKMGAPYEREFDDAISFINGKGYQIIIANQEIINQRIPKYKNLEACFS